MTPEQASERLASLAAKVPVIPVLVIEDAATARPLAEALVAGGLPLLEVTLRSASALEAITEMTAVEGAIVGVGTLLSGEDVRAARDAGAVFGVSPGATDALLDAARAEGLALLPGAATASEAMRLLEHGYSLQKFFPAEVAGGVAALKALAGPLPQIRFCPTGGIGPGNARDYLSLANVLCVGGSWLAPRAAVTAGDWNEITRLATEAAQLRGGPGA